jgi:hypothetical protein
MKIKNIVNGVIKKPRLVYYADNLLALAMPSGFYRRRFAKVLARAPTDQQEGIQARVDYYNRIQTPFPLDLEAKPFHMNFFARQRNYALDLYRYTRYFDPDYRLHHRFGDIYDVPARPTLVKARPISADNRNAVLFNLNKARHFIFVRDHRPFNAKTNRVVWRGNARQERRKILLQQYSHHPLCDVGHAHKHAGGTPWDRPYLSIHDQLKYKFVLSVEGNDVATNLKWILSSNSLCFMAAPTNETWFMEGTLIPGRHFVRLKDDYSDLIEKIEYYSAETGEAEDIIREAHRFVGQFLHPALEDAISLRVLQKYFVQSGQMPGSE